MTIRFIYQAGEQLADREAIATKIVDYLSRIVDLPQDIEIVFAMLAEHEYGNTPVNARFKNRVNVNHKLTALELPPVLLHELLHLSQIKTGKLSSTSNGQPIWNGNQYTVPKNADYQYYQNLPWEQDVANRQRKILPELIAYLAS
jgi:hypothetical protein